MSDASKKLRIELLVAGPPTKKCKQLIEMMTQFMMEFPDKLQLDIYYAGESMTKIPTDGYQRDPDNKNRRIASAYINGKKVASREVPEKNQIREILLKELGHGESLWQ